MRHSLLRRRLLLVALATVTVAGIMYWYQRSQHHQRLQNEQVLLLDELAETVDQHVLNGAIQGATELLGLAHRRVRDLVRGDAPVDNPEVLLALNTVKQDFQAEIVYVMNGEGTVIACTLLDDGQTLTGKNYRFRPYFQTAMSGSNAVYCAVGVTTQLRGLYYASPVYAKPGGPKENAKPSGAIVVKVDPFRLEQILQRFPMSVALVSPDGIVFASSRDDWLRGAVRSISDDRLDELFESRQFGSWLEAGAPDRIPVFSDRLWDTHVEGNMALVQVDLKLSDADGAWQLVGLRELDVFLPLIDWLPFSLLALFGGFMTGLFLIKAEKKACAEREKKEMIETSAVTYESIFNSINEAIFIHDWETFRVIDVNRTGVEMYGFSREEACSAELREMSLGEPPYGPEEAIAWLKKARSGEEPTFPWLARRKGGDLFWTEVNLSVATIQGERRIIASVRDMTERKELEEQVVRAERMAAVGVLAAGVAHEFNNINTSALGFAALALDSKELPDKLRPWIERIQRSLLRGNSIVKSMLSFSRSSGPQPVESNLSEVAEDVLDLVRLELRNAGVQLKRDLASVPTTAMHPDLIGQAVLNLVINAYHATQGREVREVAVRTGVDHDEVFIEIKDTGCGIPAEDIPRVFTPFFSRKGEHAVYPEQSTVRGTGLGLSVCQRIVEEHKGRIEVESEQGAGSTFTVFLPVVRLESGEDKQAEDLEPAEDSITGTRRLLLIDDDRDVLDFLKLALNQKGYDLVAIRHAEEGLRRIQTEVFDIVFLDWMLPEMDGEQFLRVFNELNLDSRPEIVVMTGLTTSDVEKNAIELGAARILHKPFGVDDVQKVVALLQS